MLGCGELKAPARGIGMRGRECVQIAHASGRGDNGRTADCTLLHICHLPSLSISRLSVSNLADPSAASYFPFKEFLYKLDEHRAANTFESHASLSARFIIIIIIIWVVRSLAGRRLFRESNANANANSTSTKPPCCWHLHLQPRPSFSLHTTPSLIVSSSAFRDRDNTGIRALCG